MSKLMKSQAKGHNDPREFLETRLDESASGYLTCPLGIAKSQTDWEQQRYPMLYLG